MKPIYLDHHATTPVDDRVFDMMLPWFKTKFGNPASQTHAYGREAHQAVQRSREQVASLMGARSSEIIFTSGATESNALAIIGAVRAHRAKSKHIITQATEHSSVLTVFRQLAEEGVEISILDVDKEGVLSPQKLESSIRSNTILVSIMFSNGEIGTIQDIEALSKITAQKNILFHCDAAQGLGLIPLDIHNNHVDLLSISSHKMYGPKGVGALYVRPNVRIKPLVSGGGQEQGLRGGTHNVPGIVGFGHAAQIMKAEGEEDAKRMKTLREHLQHTLSTKIPRTYFNGSTEHYHPANLSFRFEGVQASSLLAEVFELLALSSGSACASASPNTSHILRAIGLSEEHAQQTLRIGIGRGTTLHDIDKTSEILVAAVERLRKSRS